ncbi:MAG TPA: crotonase/enoyl-CoA hydratase family protein [Solirubrobacteraceae bacterium]|jgi:enoyl-CoA hydratase
MSELATYELDGPVATITMDDGKVNAFSIPMLQAIHAAFDQAERDRATVVLSGRENYFSAGFDLKVFASGEVDRVIEMLSLGATLAERILAFQTPVLAACTGHAVAAGSFMLLAADTRIGVDGPFQMGLNEVKIGLTVPWFAIELARQRLAPAHFSRAVIGATMYGPTDAIAAGFLDRVVTAEELRAASIEEAGRLAGLNPAAYAATKLRVRGDALQALRSAIETELTVEGLGGAQAPA